MDREQFIKFIPKPENKDVILYDTTLKDLIDIDVLEKYNELYSNFIKKKQEFLNLKEKSEEYQRMIDNIYLYKPSWNEQDYLDALQNDKKTYSTMYNDIKKIENNIEILQKKIKSIDEKIEMQEVKEKRTAEKKEKSIDEDIEKQKEKIANLRENLILYKQTLETINDEILDNENEFEFLSQMLEDLKIGNYKCKYCGSTIKVYSENSLIYKRLYKNTEQNKNELKQLLEKKKKVELNISYYESEILKIKKNLNNDIEFKKEKRNSYNKKSIEVLKLEALRDEMINNMSELKNELESNPRSHSKHFLELKERIDKYELSLDNLKRIKEIKENSNNEIQKINSLREEIKKIIPVLNKYLRFISIYFKIYEQKANEYCGDNIKFKFFKIEEYKLLEIFEITYKGIEYSQLDKKTREEVDKTLIEKFSIYF